jgi:uncharacterized protein YdaU (DUF1376 family)
MAGAMPYMPLYVADYLADAAHLTAAGHGAYLLLLMNYWQRGEALPDDDRKLMRIARMDADEWADVRDDVVEFFDVADGAWTHGRVERELEKVRKKSQQASDAGKASAERKNKTKSKPEQRTFSDRETPVERTFNHTDTDTDTDIPPPTPPAGGRRDRFDEFWREYPRKVAKEAARRAWRAAIRKADPEQIIAGARAYALSVLESDPQFVKHPATWIRGGCWDDEPPPTADRPVEDIEAKAAANAERLDATMRSKARQAIDGEITNMAKLGPLLNGGWIVDAGGVFKPGPKLEAP